MKTLLATDTASIQTDPCICQTDCTDTKPFYPTPFSWYLPRGAAVGSCQMLKPLILVAGKTEPHLLGRWSLHPSQQGGVSPSPPVNDERFIYSGTNYSKH